MLFVGKSFVNVERVFVTLTALVVYLTFLSTPSLLAATIFTIFVFYYTKLMSSFDMIWMSNHLPDVHAILLRPTFYLLYRQITEAC